MNFDLQVYTNGAWKTVATENDPQWVDKTKPNAHYVERYEFDTVSATAARILVYSLTEEDGTYPESSITANPAGYSTDFCLNEFTLYQVEEITYEEEENLDSATTVYDKVNMSNGNILGFGYYNGTDLESLTSYNDGSGSKIFDGNYDTYGATHGQQYQWMPPYGPNVPALLLNTVKGGKPSTINAIELAAKVFCNEGDTVICENPTFIGGLNAFRSCGYNTVGVPLEDDGMNIEALEETIKNTPNAKLLYVIPTFQNPTGITTSLEKRKAIYEVCKKYNLMILEDNPYGELRFAGEEIPTIKSMDTEGLVIYCSSFSKILSAGMRVGFVVAPEAVAAKMVVAKQSEDVHTNLFFQMLCYKFMTECDLDAHIAKIRDLYCHKCSLMLECLERELPASVKFTRPEGGLFIWVTLPDGVDAAAFLKAAIAEKLMIVPGATFNCDTTAPSQAFRLNYSTPSDAQIKEGVARLGRVARSFVD